MAGSETYNPLVAGSCPAGPTIVKCQDTSRFSSDLNANELPLVTVDDEVDFLPVVKGAEVPHRRAVSLRNHSHRQCDKGFEEFSCFVCRRGVERRREVQCSQVAPIRSRPGGSPRGDVLVAPIWGEEGLGCSLCGS